MNVFPVLYPAGFWRRFRKLVGGLGGVAAAWGLPIAALASSCDPVALNEAQAVFEQMVALRSVEPSLVDELTYRAAARVYIDAVEACSGGLTGEGLAAAGLDGGFIDTGGVWFSDSGGAASAQFVTFGTKWGEGTSFPAGEDVPGPRIPGGTVTYSFMADGVSLSAEGAGTNTAITSLPTYNSCFLADIALAFAAWSAVSNIQFVQVADSGAAFNSYFAAGDIRIGAHTFDGASGTLAHGYYPPPNGWSAAGDIHLDVDENWSCGGGGFDVGIVMTHEIGHAIGLGHEPTTGAPAIMQPYYNASVSLPLYDDIQGASSIYNGDTRFNFDADAYTDIFWRKTNGATWFYLMNGTNIGSQSAGDFVSTDWSVAGLGDFNGDGDTDILWRKTNGASWFYLMNGMSVASSDAGPFVAPEWTVAGIGDFDGDGKDDILWSKANGATWIYLMNGTAIASQGAGNTLGSGWAVAGVADFDADGKSDILLRNVSGATWFYFMDGLSLASEAAGVFVAPQWQIAGIGDFDRDGKADVFWRRPSSGATWFHLMDGAAIKSEGAGNTVPLVWSVALVRDFSGDGKTDIFWRKTNGASWFYVMDGMTIASESAGPFVSTDWQVVDP